MRRERAPRRSKYPVFDDFAPFELTFERIGRFERRGGDLWWAGIALTRDLKELQNALSRGMASVGFELDSRPFKPHVTLARQILEKITITAPSLLVRRFAPLS